MCPSCIPALPTLAGALSGGGLIFGLRFLLISLRSNLATAQRVSFRLKEGNS